MSEPHLPECLTPNDGYLYGICICDRLCACEARVWEECDEHYRKNVNEAITVSYDAALDAARDAVAAAPAMTDGGATHRLALVAIDALRGAE